MSAKGCGKARAEVTTTGEPCRWDGVEIFGNSERHSLGQSFGAVGDRSDALSLSLSVMRIGWAAVQEVGGDGRW